MPDDDFKPVIQMPNVNDLIQNTNELTDQIIAENDPDKIEDLTKLFLLNQKKKNIARLNKLTNLLEIVDDETLTRFMMAPESFDNDQLLKYINSTQQNITAVENAITQTPLVQITNNEINVNNTFELDRESRKKVFDAINQLLNSNSEIVDVEG